LLKIRTFHDGKIMESFLDLPPNGIDKFATSENLLRLVPAVLLFHSSY